MKKAITLFVFMIISLNTNADVSASFKAGEQFAKARVNEVTTDATQLDPHQIPGFKTAHPSETKYHSAQIDKYAKQKLKTSPVGQFVDSSYQHRQHDKINKSDKLITRANRILQHAGETARDAGSYCSNGHCTNTHYPPSPDFNQAVSALSAAGAAEHDMDKQIVCDGPWWHRRCHYVYHIFTGAGMACRIIAFGYSNCCADKGWGHDIGLAGCRSEEKKLGFAKERGVCHYVGRYCSKYIHFVFGKACVQHSKSYCCFKNKLARIVQEGGRAQLGEGWGQPKTPDCHGFTPEEFSRIDFSKIDFSSFYEDIKKEMHPPNIPVTQAHIRQQVEKAIHHGKQDE